MQGFARSHKFNRSFNMNFKKAWLDWEAQGELALNDPPASGQSWVSSRTDCSKVSSLIPFERKHLAPVHGDRLFDLPLTSQLRAALNVCLRMQLCELPCVLSLFKRRNTKKWILLRPEKLLFSSISMARRCEQKEPQGSDTMKHCNIRCFAVKKDEFIDGQGHVSLIQSSFASRKIH